MAEKAPIRIPVPSSMDCKGDVASNWDFFIAQWENYEIATGLDKKDDKVEELHCCQ